jgi:hypothetical protein
MFVAKTRSLKPGRGRAIRLGLTFPAFVFLATNAAFAYSPRIALPQHINEFRIPVQYSTGRTGTTNKYNIGPGSSSGSSQYRVIVPNLNIPGTKGSSSTTQFNISPNKSTRTLQNNKQAPAISAPSNTTRKLQQYNPAPVTGTSSRTTKKLSGGQTGTTTTNKGIAPLGVTRSTGSAPPNLSIPKTIPFGSNGRISPTPGSIGKATPATPTPYVAPRPSNASQAKQATQGQGGGAGRTPPPGSGPNLPPQPFDPLRGQQPTQINPPPAPPGGSQRVEQQPSETPRSLSPSSSGNVQFFMNGQSAPSTTPAQSETETESPSEHPASASEPSSPAAISNSGSEMSSPGSSSSSSSSSSHQSEQEDAARRAEREAHERAMHEAARAARQGSKARAKSNLGYEDVDQSGMGAPSMAIIDSGATSSMISNLSGILANQPAVNVTPNNGLCGDGFERLCEKAAKEAAKELEKALRKARAKAKREARKRNRERKKKMRAERRKAKKEARKRERARKRSKAAEKRARLKEELRKKGPKLREEGKKLGERGKKLTEEQERLNEQERKLRKAEGEARKNDPNCRGSACQNARDARAENSRAITNNSREMGKFQSDNARHTGQTQDFQRKANQIARMDDAGMGMTKSEFRSHKADQRLAKAHQDVNTIENRLRELDEARDEIGRKGGSGSKQWNDIQREMDALNEALPKAQSYANGQASQDAVKAKAYAMGLGKEYQAYEKAQQGAQTVKDRNALAEKFKGQGVKIADARKAGASDAEIEKLQNTEDKLLRELREANKDVDRFGRSAAKGVKGKSVLKGKELDASFKGEQREFVGAFNEKRSLENMTDRELAERNAIFKAAEDRIDQASSGIGEHIHRSKSGAYRKQSALENQKLDAEEKLEAMDKSMSDAFLRGPVFASTGEAYAKARQDVVDEIAGLDQEISKFAPLDYAEAVIAESNGVTKQLNSLLDGFPKNDKGGIDTGKLAKQVVVVGRTQMELSRIAGEIGGLEKKAASGKPLTAREKSRLGQLKTTAGKMTAELKKTGLDVKIKDGQLDVKADNLLGSVTWNASRDAITENIKQINKTKTRVAQLRQQPKPGDLLPSPPEAGNDAGVQSIVEGSSSVTQLASGGSTRSIAEVSSTPQPIGKTRVRGSSSESSEPTPKIDYQPGGILGKLVAKINKAAKEATDAVGGVMRQVAENALWNQKKAVTPAELAVLRAQADADREKAQAEYKEVLRKRKEAQQAAADRNEAGERLKEKQKTLEGYGKNRIRQAREYRELAEGNQESADKFGEKAADNEAKGDKLRLNADQLDDYADRIEATDKTLAANARKAAANARTDAKAYDKLAEGYRGDETLDRGDAKRLGGRSNEILGEARDLVDDYNLAVDNYQQKLNDANLKIGEFQGLAGELNASNDAANASARELAMSQNWNFNHLLENQPSGDFYSGMNSDQRAEWRRENIPNWDRLTIDQKTNYLKRIDISEASRQYQDAEKEYKAFTAKTDMSPDAVQARLDLRKAKLKEVDKIKDQWTSTPADRKRIERLESEADVILDQVRADQQKIAGIGNEYMEKRQKLNKLVWASNEKARSEEIGRRVDFVAQAKGELQLAEHAADAREKAFQTRMSTLTNKDERARLQAVHDGFKTQDAGRIRGLQKIYNERLEQTSLDSAFDNLGEIGNERELSKVVDGRLKQSGVVAGRLKGQTKLANDLADAVNVKGEKFNPLRALVTAYDRVKAGEAAVGGAVVGIVKGTGKAIYGLAKLVIWEPIDTLGERTEHLMEAATGYRTNVFGTDNREFAENLVADPKGVGWNMLMGLGKMSFDAYQDVKKLGVSIEAGEAGHAFDASMGASEFLAETLIDPTIVLGGLGKGLKALTFIGKFDDLARAAAKGAGAVDGGAAAALRAVDDLDLDKLGGGLTRLNNVIGTENLVQLGRITAKGDDLLRAAGTGIGDFAGSVSRKALGNIAVDKLKFRAGQAVAIGSMKVGDVASKAGIGKIKKTVQTPFVPKGILIKPVKPVNPVKLTNPATGVTPVLPTTPAGTPALAGRGAAPAGLAGNPVKLVNPGRAGTPALPRTPTGAAGAPVQVAALTPPGGRVPGLRSPAGPNRAPLSGVVNDSRAPLIYTPPPRPPGSRRAFRDEIYPPARTTRLPPPDLPPAGTVRLPPPDLPPAANLGARNLKNPAAAPPPARGPPAGVVNKPAVGATPVAGGNFGASPGGFGASPRGPATPGGFGASPVGPAKPGGFGASPGGPAAPGGFGASPGGFGRSPGGPGGKPKANRPEGFQSGGSTGGVTNLKKPVAPPPNMKTVDIVTVGNDLGPGVVRIKPPGAKQPIVLKQSDFLGEGSSSKAYSIPGTQKGDDLGRAFKFTRRGDSSFKLDDLGGGVVDKIDKATPGVVQTPTLHARYQIGKHERFSGKVKGEKEFSGGFVSEMDQTPPSVHQMKRAAKGDKNPAITHLDADGRLSALQTRAFHRGTDAINGTGHAWVDNHTGNFSFNKSNAPNSNGAVLVVTDPGGIIPMKATRLPDGTVKTAAQNARDLQQAIHNPPAHIRELYKGIRGQVEHQKWLAKQFDGAVDWDQLSKLGGKDIRSLGKPDVPEAQLLSFNPRISIDRPELFAFGAPKAGARPPVVGAAKSVAKPPPGTARLGVPDLPPPSGTANLGRLDMPPPGTARLGAPDLPPPSGTANLGRPDLPPPGTARLATPDLPRPGTTRLPAAELPPTKLANPAAARPAPGAPAHGRSGVQKQQFCENCGLVAGEAILKDAGIIAGERSQALMRQFAIDRNLLIPGQGMRMDQLQAYMHMNGVHPKHMQAAARTPAEMGFAIQRGEDVAAVIQNGKGGYHMVRVEGFTRDAAGKAWVSLGEGGLPAGMSKRVPVSEFRKITRTYPATPGGPPGPIMQSLSVNRKGLTAAERTAARATAADNVSLAGEAAKSRRPGTTRLPPAELPNAAGSVGARATPVAGNAGRTPSAVTAKTALEAPPANVASLPKTALEAPPVAGSLPKTALEAPPGSASLPKTAIEAPPGAPAAAKAAKPVKPPPPPYGKAKVVREDGSELVLDFGEELGAGSTSTAYRNQAAKDKQALRVTRAPETAGKSPSTLAQQRDIGIRAEKLDDFGRAELGFMADKNGAIHLPDGTIIRTPRVIERIKLSGKGEGPLKGATVVEIVELAPASFNNVVAKTGKGMTRGQAVAFDKAHRFLNDKGLVWLDNHAGNFGFKHLGGDKWEFWIIDPGGIVPVTKVGTKSASAVARDMQKIINHPPKKLVDKFLAAGSKNARTKIALGMMKKIIVKHGDAIDVGRIGLSGPEQLIFNPSGVLPFRRAHQLFGTEVANMESMYRTYAKSGGGSAAKEVAAVDAASKTLPWAPPDATAPWTPGQAAP